jgi:hypothetical protein
MEGCSHLLTGKIFICLMFVLCLFLNISTTEQVFSMLKLLLPIKINPMLQPNCFDTYEESKLKYIFLALCTIKATIR